LFDVLAFQSRPSSIRYCDDWWIMVWEGLGRERS